MVMNPETVNEKKKQCELSNKQNDQITHKTNLNVP